MSTEQPHIVTYKGPNLDPNQFRWEATCTCSWHAVGPSKESLEIIAVDHDLWGDELNIDPFLPQTQKEITTMMRLDGLLTREILINFFAMLSSDTRKKLRDEVHKAHIDAQEDVKKEREGSPERAEVKAQEDLSLYMMQVIDAAQAEFDSLDQPVNVSGAKAPVGEPIKGAMNEFKK